MSALRLSDSRNAWLDDKRTVGSLGHAVDAKSRVALSHMAGLDCTEGGNRVHAAVLGQGHGDGLKGVSKGSHRVLFKR